MLQLLAGMLNKRERKTTETHLPQKQNDSISAFKKNKPLMSLINLDLVY